MGGRMSMILGLRLCMEIGEHAVDTVHLYGTAAGLPFSGFRGLSNTDSH